jgi:hypothetical protein
MRILAVPLVFNEHIRRGDFAYVVIKRADADEQSVGSDGACRVFRELSDGVRMLIRARRAKRKLAEHR